MDRPVSGDVIITTRTQSAAVYLLSRFEEPPSVYFANINDAIRIAFGFAKDLQVDVWFLDDEQSYLRLEECRKQPF